MPTARSRNGHFGVIKFTLKPGGYDWQFIPIAGPDVHRLWLRHECV